MSHCLVMHNTLELAKQLDLFLSFSCARGQNQVQRINPASNSSPKHNILYKFQKITCNLTLFFLCISSHNCTAFFKGPQNHYLSYFWMIQWLAYHPKKPVRKLKVKTKKNIYIYRPTVTNIYLERKKNTILRMCSFNSVKLQELAAQS